MKNKKLLMSASATLVILSAGCAFAQDDADATTFAPVETYTCNYNDGKGPADLQKAVDSWTKYADGAGMDNYFAVLLTPHFFGDETFDVGWLGSTNTGEELGSALDHWLKNGGKAADAFNAAITCDSHSMFASTMLKPPPEGGPPESIVLTFADCSVADGKSFEEVFTGIDDFVEYQNAHGYTHGSWALFPAYGVSDLDYDFKMVNAFDDHGALGMAFDKIAGGDWEVREEMLGDLMDCDVARVYVGQVVRTISAE